MRLAVDAMANPYAGHPIDVVIGIESRGFIFGAAVADRLNTGFTVTPRVGLSVVQCLTLTSANDAPERDPASYTLEGSYDGSNFTAIASGAVPFGALLGGLIGDTFGLRVALAAGALSGFMTIPWLWFSPWRRESPRPSTPAPAASEP